MDQQINTFEVLYPAVARDGIYMCEDMHTSYWKNYGGGFKARGTFVEYSKYLIDYLNVQHCPKLLKPKLLDFAQTAYGLHYYDSMLVIENRVRPESKRQITGKPSFPPDPKRTLAQRAHIRLLDYSRIIRHKLLYRPFHRRG